ncbi:MAG TPA: hypothetical protein VFC63_11795 [Blastocatellia bacterium]|nr:hypothetical protein [Blastocatellia bacterium]
MAQRTNDRDKLSFKISAMSDSEVTEVLDYISIMETMRVPRIPEGFEDEVIALLADATENRRAQIVHEWDRIRRRADVRAGIGSTA